VVTTEEQYPTKEQYLEAVLATLEFEAAFAHREVVKFEGLARQARERRGHYNRSAFDVRAELRKLRDHAGQ
jgi:hypothetical protein